MILSKLEKKDENNKESGLSKVSRKLDKIYL